jgi:hypothetical protein
VDEQEIPAAAPSDRSTGRFIVGALLVAAGAALLIERLGAMPPAWRDRIWPMLLIGYGVARLLQPRAQGREGLFFVLAGAWWLAGLAGWISLERTWPLLFVALGVSIMMQSLTASRDVSGVSTHIGRRPRGATPWLLLAILVGASVSSGLGRHINAGAAPQDGVLRVYSVLGGSSSRMHATRLAGGEVVSIMGGSTIDLRDVTIAPGETVTLDLFTLMGGGAIRVSDQWVVDVQTVQVMGGVKDRRIPLDRGPDEPGARDAAAAAGPAPRLILRGTIIMGGLTIRS